MRQAAKQWPVVGDPWLVEKATRARPRALGQEGIQEGVRGWGLGIGKGCHPTPDMGHSDTAASIANRPSRYIISRIPNPQSLAPRRQAARGITLLELLVVMMILLMVTAAAIPIVAPALQNRQMREATRMVTAYFGAAKARAVQTGRPVGVVIQRFEDNAFALQIAQVEVPPPYSGDVVNSRLLLAESTSPSAGAQDHLNARYGYEISNNIKGVKWFNGTEPVAGQFNNQMVKVGDQIQFNGQGPLLLILGPDANSDGVIDAISSSTPLDIAFVHDLPLRQVLPWSNTGGGGLPLPQPPTYQVFRQPVRTSAPPMQLPEGIVFDLSVSGMGSTLFNTANYNTTPTSDPPPIQEPLVRFDPTIIFSPSGRVEWVNNNLGQLVRPTDPIYLLLGRRELMFDVTNRGADGRDLVFQNLSAPAPLATPMDVMPPAPNFWVIVGPQTGQVNTAEVAPHIQDYTNDSGNGGLTSRRDVITMALFGNATRTGALSFAREAQSLGGR